LFFHVLICFLKAFKGYAASAVLKGCRRFGVILLDFWQKAKYYFGAATTFCLDKIMG
jgi:hypothetical protein